MTKNYTLKLKVFLTLLMTIAFNGIGQITLGSDNAGNYGSWTNGSNAGIGFSNWDLFANPNGGSAGRFLASSAADGFGNIDTASKAFGMFANPFSGGPNSNAQRFLNNTGSTQVGGRSFLLPGQSFKIDLAIAFLNGNKGIDLFDQNFGLLFNFKGDNNQYVANSVNLGWTYSDTSIFRIEVQQTDTNTYVVNIIRGSDTYTSGNRTGQFSGFKTYIISSNNQARDNLYFNNLQFQRCAVVTTWNGSSWNNGLPNKDKQVAFTGNFTSSGNIEACSLSVSNGAVVNIAGGATPHTLTVENNITVSAGSQLVFNSNSSLIQTNPTAVNTGSINYKRDSTPMRTFEYTYWGSPVAGQTLIGFSPNTLTDRFYKFNAAPTTNTWVVEPANNVMTAGTGYAIRSPQTFNASPQTFNGEFVGIPNNGNISQSVFQFDPGILNYNLLSNPYPSAINTNLLLENSNLGALYFWTHNTAINNNVFTTNDYAIRTRTTSTAAVSGGSIPGATIAAGQGFFASASSNGTVTFTNAMREVGNNSQFYRTTQTTQVDPVNYYIHLNFTNVSSAFKQIAVGYQEQATNGYDFGIDALASTEGIVAFYSIVSPFTFGFGIQGRAFPLGIVDQVPLGFSTTIAGDYTIEIDHFDPHFSDKNILLEDTTTGVFHDLKVAPYNFTTASGTFNSRFKMVYQNSLLNAVDFSNLSNDVYVYNQNNEIGINSPSQKINTIEIYNMLGQLIYQENAVNQNAFVISKITKINQTLIVKTKLENGQNIVKKLIF